MNYFYPNTATASGGMGTLFVDAACGDDSFTIGGGTLASGGFGEQRIRRSFSANQAASADPAPDDFWSSTVDNLGATDRSVTTYAICGPA